jgi:surfeit locus 1 family protein
VLKPGYKRCFKPGLWSTLAVVLLAPLFGGLGYWQLQRAAEKQAVIQQRADAELAGHIKISGLEPADELHLKKVKIACAPDQQRQLLLDNRVHRQQVGYEVLMACVMDTNVAVLLNRGWVRAGASRQQLPDVPVFTSRPNAIGGYFAVPGKGFTLGRAVTPTDSGWPRRVQFYDFDALGGLLSLSLIPGVIYLDRSSPMVLTYNWRPIEFGPEKHYGYAFQWFALMLTLLVLYLVLNSSKAVDEPGRNHIGRES